MVTLDSALIKITDSQSNTISFSLSHNISLSLTHSLFLLLMLNTLLTMAKEASISFAPKLIYLLVFLLFSELPPFARFDPHPLFSLFSYRVNLLSSTLDRFN